MNRCNAITDLFLPVFATFLSKDSKCFINPPQSYTLPLFNIKMKRQQFYLTIKKNYFAITIFPSIITTFINPSTTPKNRGHWKKTENARTIEKQCFSE